MSQHPHLYAARGGGSAIIEALFALAGQPFDVTYVEWGHFGDDDSPLLAVNPMAEVPTLKLPNGEILTESAAITLWLGDRYPESTLVPAPDHPARAQFLRWLVWLVAAVYPTFSFGDHPERLLGAGAEARALRHATDTRREGLWRQMEATLVPAPWLMGADMTALDVFITVMTWWRPRRVWFKSECPGLYAVAERLSTDDRLRPVWERNNAPL